MNKNQVVYTNDEGYIDSSDYNVQTPYCIVVGPNVSDSEYKTDGIADEVQINAAILAANTAGGGTVILQAGTYNIVNNISLRSNVTLRGQGRATKIVVPATKSIFVDVREHVTLRDFSIDALGQSVNNFGIYIGNSEDIWVDNVWGQYKGFGVFIASGSSDTKRVKVTNSYFYGLAHNDLIGGGPLTTGSFEVYDVILENNFLEHDLTQPNSGTYVNVIDIVAVKYTTFKNNQTRGRIVFGSEQNPNQFSQMTGNIVRKAIGSTAQTEIQVITTDPSVFSSTNLLITNNIVEDGIIRVTGQPTKRAKNIIISNNTVTAGVGICVLIGDSEGVTINNNNLSNFGDAAIRISDSDHINVVGNLFKSGSGVGVKDISIPQSSNILVAGNYFDSVTTALQVSSGALTTANRSNTVTLKGINNNFGTITTDNIRTTKSDASTTGFFQNGGAAPNQEFNILPDHTRQVGATTVNANFGFNSDVSQWRFFSKWGGSNTNLFTIDATTNLNTSFNPIVVNTIQERTAAAGVTIDGVLIKDSLDVSGIVDKTSAQSVAGVKTFTSNTRFSSLSMLGTDGNYLPFVTGAGSASPNQDINFFADYTKQVGATTVINNYGFNGEISNYRWYSKWSGTNTLLFGVNAVSNTVDAINSDLRIVSVGKGLRIAEGSNAKMGVATLVAGTVTVANTSVTTNSRIFLTSQVGGGTPGFLRVSARSAGTSFTITSSSNTDTSVVAYQIIEPS